MDDPNTPGFDEGVDRATGAGLISADRALLAITRGGVSGKVYNDRNGNGKRDAGEEGLPGTKVFLDLNGDGQVSTLAPVTVNAPGLPFAIPNPGTLISDLTLVDFVGDIAKLVLKLNISHAFVGDLEAFLVSECARGQTLVLVIVGRGHNSAGKRPVLRREIVDWLTSEPLAQLVLAFHTAPPEFGGEGSLLVRLSRENP
jgi:hypothetical protein